MKSVEALIPSLNKDHVEAYAERIVGMMRDNGCTMVDALLWDFESWGYDAEQDYYNRGISFVEECFIEYLKDNRVYNADGMFYLDIFMGRRENMVLRKIDADAQSKGK